MKHQTRKGDQMQSRHGSGKPLIVAGQTPKARHPGKGAFHHPAPGQQDKAMLGLWQLDDGQLDALGGRRLGRSVSSIGLVDKGHLHRLAGGLLHPLRQLAHLGAILLIGRRDQQGQQMPQRIDRHMHFAAFAPLGTIIARMAATLGRRLQHAAIENGGSGLAFAPFDSAQQQAQVLHHRLEGAGRQPALRLLINDVPGRQIMRHHAPSRSRAHHPAQAVIHFSQAILSLSGILGQQRQIRRDESPFVVAHITWVGISRVHATILAWLPTRIPNRLYWQDIVNQLNGEVGQNNTARDQGLTSLGDEFNKSASRLNEQRSNTLRDFGISQDTLDTNKRNTVNDINRGAENSNRSLLGLLASRGAGVSSAAQYAVPDAISSYYGGQRNNALTSYGQQQRGLDIAKGDATQGYNNAEADLESQCKAKEQALRQSALSTENDLLSRLSDATSQLKMAQGGTYSGTAADRQPFLDRVAANRAAINQLADTYRTPTYNVTPVNASVPDISAYNTDPLAIDLASSGTPVNTPTTYLPFLQKKKQPALAA
jgi:hypothetical protein